jgi:hypothetical protein
LTAQVVYSSIPNPLPGNVGSEGAEAYAFSELGDGLVVSTNGGTLQKVTVIMSDWACEHGHWYIAVGSVGSNGDGPCVTAGKKATYSQSITLNVYSVINSGGGGGTADVLGTPAPGILLGSATETFDVPFRPSSDGVNCGPAAGGDGEAWYSPKDKTCYHGIAFPIVFDFSKQSDITVPASVIVGVQYNTSDYGPTPQRPQPCNSLTAPDNDNCPYDSLNISTDSGGEATPPTNTVYVGSFLDPNSIFVNYTSSANACPGNTVTGSFAIDYGCWAGFHPEIQVMSTKPPKPPKTKKGPPPAI